jgi:curli biogenesis system outer membrane secretion channel CsgG
MRSMFASRLCACAALLVLAVTVAAGPANAAEDRVRVAVLDFDTDALHSNWRYGWHYSELAGAAADTLTHELVQIPQFSMIERQRINDILAEQDLGASGRVDPATAAQIGRLLGAQLAVVGSVTEFGVSEMGGRIPQVGKWKWGRGIGGKVHTGRAVVTARLVDTTTGEILGSYQGEGKHRFGKGAFAGADFGKTFDSGTASKVLAEAMTSVAEGVRQDAAHIEPARIVKAIDGKVAKVDGATVYLNVGSADGVQPGDRLEIRRMGAVIRDPDTGEVLGGEETTVGTVEVTKVINDRLCTASAVTGSGFETGDRAVSK